MARSVFRAIFVNSQANLLEMADSRRSRIGGAAVTAGSHRDYDVLALLAVEIFHAQQHLVFLNAELRLLADGQKHGVLLIPRTNAVDHVFGLQEIFLAKKLVRLLAAGIGAEHFTGETLAVFLRHAAGYRIHLQELAGLKRLGLLCVCHQRQEQQYTEHHLESHVNLPREKYARGVEASIHVQVFSRGTAWDGRSLP